LRRFVIDANTLASGCVDPHGDSPPCLLYRNMAGTLFETTLCPELIAELAGTLRKPYFAARISHAEVQDICAGVEAAATMLPDPSKIQTILRDASDDYILALARSAEAEAIITGDHDLLDHQDIAPPAITPRQACERLNLTG
jgi:putative PIN family toxin of toxin-antitoxin system